MVLYFTGTVRQMVVLAIIGTAREAAGQRSVVLDVVVVRLFQAANAVAFRLKLADQLRMVCAGRRGIGDRVRITVVARQCRGGCWAGGSVKTLHEEVVLALSELQQTAGGRSLENNRRLPVLVERAFVRVEPEGRCLMVGDEHLLLGNEQTVRLGESLGLLLKATGRRGLERVVVFHLGEREFAVLGELPEAAAGLLL